MMAQDDQPIKRFTIGLVIGLACVLLIRYAKKQFEVIEENKRDDREWNEVVQTRSAKQSSTASQVSVMRDEDFVAVPEELWGRLKFGIYWCDRQSDRIVIKLHKSTADMLSIPEATKIQLESAIENLAMRVAKISSAIDSESGIPSGVRPWHPKTRYIISSEESEVQRIHDQFESDVTTILRPGASRLFCRQLFIQMADDPVFRGGGRYKLEVEFDDPVETPQGLLFRVTERVLSGGNAGFAQSEFKDGLPFPYSRIFKVE